MSSKIKKIKYQTRRVTSCFNRVIELNQKLLILKQQYLSTNNFSINNTHFVIKSSQTTQLYITKVIYKHFSCHHHIKKHFLQQIVLKGVTGSRCLTLHSGQTGN
jgi:hypothetical protein